MKYLCIEENRIVSALDYEPSVPSGVEVVSITDDDYKLINDGTHYFDTNSKSVTQKPKLILDKMQEDKDKDNLRQFLNDTDWKVLRHIRQKALNAQTTLSEEEYIALEQERTTAASKI